MNDGEKTPNNKKTMALVDILLIVNRRSSRILVSGIVRCHVTRQVEI